MAGKMKPYTLDWKKSQKPDLTEIDINQWREIVMTHARAEDNWGPIINTNKWDEKGLELPLFIIRQQKILSR